MAKEKDLLLDLLNEKIDIEKSKESKKMDDVETLNLIFSSSENGMLGNIIFTFCKDEESIYKKIIKIEELTSIIYSFINCSFSTSVKDDLTLSLYIDNELIQTYDCSSPQDEEDIYNFLYNRFVNKGEQE